MRQFKLVIAGSPGSGKTTAIHTLCGDAAVHTEAGTRTDYGPDKSTITVALDYGTLDLGGGDRLHLYGTPGQERFDFMWDILLHGSLGVALLIDNSTPDPLADLRRFVEAFTVARSGHTFVVGVTHTDQAPQPTIEEYRKILAATTQDPPIFEIDARRVEDVSMLLMALLYDIDSDLLTAASRARANDSASASTRGSVAVRHWVNSDAASG